MSAYTHSKMGGLTCKMLKLLKKCFKKGETFDWNRCRKEHVFNHVVITVSSAFILFYSAISILYVICIQGPEFIPVHQFWPLRAILVHLRPKQTDIASELQPVRDRSRMVQVYSVISSLKTHQPTLHSLDLFLSVSHTFQQPFRRIERIVHIAYLSYQVLIYIWVKWGMWR